MDDVDEVDRVDGVDRGGGVVEEALRWMILKTSGDMGKMRGVVR